MQCSPSPNSKVNTPRSLRDSQTLKSSQGTTITSLNTLPVDPKELQNQLLWEQNQILKLNSQELDALRTANHDLEVLVLKMCCQMDYHALNLRKVPGLMKFQQEGREILSHHAQPLMRKHGLILSPTGQELTDESHLSHASPMAWHQQVSDTNPLQEVFSLSELQD